ncbi:unnamed protein product [marine sediment metagenome]|uniref:Zn-dependent metallo-hydrolase RNA specificity domain-containing protein n=1 Tax=marine sediment metagenome TaxID=412755 RepID=X1AEX2_9ZZZZ
MKLTIHRGSKEIGGTCIELQLATSRILIDFDLPLVDHSGFDALAFLIEGKDKKIFYSGDFRGHGRKSVLFDNIVKNPPNNIDYLILEGSMIGRDKGAYETEKDIENELISLFNKGNLVFMACSSQNIDRLVSIYRACVKSNRIFVIDPYTAFILDRLKKISPNIPQFDWGKHNIPIIEVHSSGHAYVEELQQFVKAIKPKHIIPNHTFYPEKYNEYFDGNIKFIKDKETVEL